MNHIYGMFEQLESLCPRYIYIPLVLDILFAICVTLIILYHALESLFI
jgi:hypothetical protein